MNPMLRIYLRVTDSLITFSISNLETTAIPNKSYVLSHAKIT